MKEKKKLTLPAWIFIGMLAGIVAGLIFLALGLDVPFIYCVVALSCASLVGNLMAFIPMQIGTREMGLALAMSWVGLASPLSLTASIMSRIREIIYTAAGTLMMLIHNGELPSAATAAPLDAEEPAEASADLAAEESAAYAEEDYAMEVPV